MTPASTPTPDDGIHPDLTGLAVPIETLAPLPGNPRRGDVEAVMRSYVMFGQRKPIVARREGAGGIVLAGNHQLEAARRLGWPSIAVVWVDDDDLTAKAFALADNRTAELGDYDDEALAAMLAVIADSEELMAAASFSVADFEAIAGLGSGGGGLTDPDDVPEPPPVPVSARGDVWLLGPHRLLCGDGRDASDVERLLDGSVVNLAFTSPPYADRRKYDESSGFKPIHPDAYVEWFEPIAANVAAHLAPDGSWFVNIKAASDGLDQDLYVLDLVAAHVRRWGWHLATEFCWERVGIPGLPARRFKNQFEPVYQFARGEWKFRPDAVKVSSTAAFAYEAGHGKSLVGNQGAQGEEWFAAHNVGEGLAYPGNRLPTFAGSHEATGHSAAFPVGLPAWFIRAYSDEGDTVYDPFMGSGSTLLAADKHDRIAFGMELSPGYCDVICRRYQLHTGTLPIHEATGEPHDFEPAP